MGPQQRANAENHIVLESPQLLLPFFADFPTTCRMFLALFKVCWENSMSANKAKWMIPAKTPQETADFGFSLHEWGRCLA
jgi:hypothetical protein